MVYAERRAPGEWELRSLANGSAFDPFGMYPCPENPEPHFPSQTCTYRYDAYRGLALATSNGGDVRAIYLHSEVSGDLSAHCFPPTEAGQYCEWVGPIDVHGELVLAAPNGEGFDRQVIASDVLVSSAVAAVDSRGRVHLAASDATSTVRYLLIGPETASTATPSPTVTPGELCNPLCTQGERCRADFGGYVLDGYCTNGCGCFVEGPPTQTLTPTPTPASCGSITCTATVTPTPTPTLSADGCPEVCDGRRCGRLPFRCPFTGQFVFGHCTADGVAGGLCGCVPDC